MKRQKVKRVIAAALSAAMILASIPQSVMASQGNVTEDVIMEETVESDALQDDMTGDASAQEMEAPDEVTKIDENQADPTSDTTAQELVEEGIEAKAVESDINGETTTNGDWSIENDGTNGVAKFGTMGFEYVSVGTEIAASNADGISGVASKGSNGAADASTYIVKTNAEKVSYTRYTAPSGGVLLVHVKNASGKTGYVSCEKNGETRGIGTFVPGLEGNYDTDEFKVSQGGHAVLSITCEAGVTYYVTLVGSKMACLKAEFVANKAVNATVEDEFGLGKDNFAFTNNEDGSSVKVENVSSTFSADLQPGTYTVSVIGDQAREYAVSPDTNTVVISGDTSGFKIKIVKAITYYVSGSITGIKGRIPDDLKIYFVPEDTASHTTATATITEDVYSVMLFANDTYTVQISGASDYHLDGEVTVSSSGDDVEKNIALKASQLYEVSGRFIGLTEIPGEYEALNVTPSKIIFKEVNDGYTYDFCPVDGEYEALLRDGAYQASIVLDGYSTVTHVVVDGANVVRDILLKDETPAQQVEYRDTLYVGSSKEFKTVQAAVDHAANMGERGADKRVTIKIDPGMYREQVKIDTPYISFESNGGTRENTKITWYYGIGYKYYSYNSKTKFYDPYLAYDKFGQDHMTENWGGAVVAWTNATGFTAKDITFENSFNKYLTAEELEDGVAPSGGESIRYERKESTRVVDSKAATERAAAFVNRQGADKLEFLNCAFIGSQDTLYTSNKPTDSYYKNCYIEGMTDFIYGDGDVLFEGCELNFCGYSDAANAGYLTAHSGGSNNNPAPENGYVFKNCYVSSNADRKVLPGFFERTWGPLPKVAFINTVIEKENTLDPKGWTSMSSGGNPATLDTLVEYNTTVSDGSNVDTTQRINKNKASESIEESLYTVDNMFIKNNWTPGFYTPLVDTVPEFETEPTFKSNGDLNMPNPGETVTVIYSLGEEWNANDASVIEWYALDTDYATVSNNSVTLDSVLKKATLLSKTTGNISRSFKLPMECAGKYFMVVVTAATSNKVAGEKKFAICDQKPVSDSWNDPSDPGSVAPGSGINIYLAGDSTVKDYSALGMYNSGKTRNEGSWGEFLQDFFDEKKVTVVDYAEGGRATRSFVNEGKLDNILRTIKEGDYLFIQFGHNDSANQGSYYEDRFVPLYTADTKEQTTKGVNYPTSGFPVIKPLETMKNNKGVYSWDCGATYKGFIQYYIDEALERGATPVIMTPVARMYFETSGSGKIRPHHDATGSDYAPTEPYRTEGNAYVTACRELYEENKGKGVYFIDSFDITVKMFEDAFAEGGSSLAAAVMNANESTHSNKTGGVIQAGYIASQIKDAGWSISGYVKKPENVYGVNMDGNSIFTIKDGVFTAKDNNYEQQPYWSSVGQEVFDGLDVKVPVDSLNLDSEELPLNIGESRVVNAQTDPAGVAVEWTTSNEGIATVADGKITAVGEGTATITATAGDKTKTVRVVVSKIAVESLLLDTESVQLKAGESKIVKATIAPENASVSKPSWSSDNEDVAIVLKNGVIKAVGVGSAVITADADGKKKTVAVTVSGIPVESVSIVPSEDISVKAGTSMQVKCEITPSDASIWKAQWTSSDPGVATVANGLIKGVAEGTALITAQADGKSAQIKVTVTPADKDSDTNPKPGDEGDPNTDKGALSVEKLFEKSAEGYGAVTDTLPVKMNGKKAVVNVSDNMVKAIITVASNSKFTLNAAGATGFVSDQRDVKVNKKGVVKVKKNFAGKAVITFNANGQDKVIEIIASPVGISSQVSGNVAVKKLNVTATGKAGDSISFVIKAPLSTRFDQTSKKFKNKGVMSEINIVPDAQGQWHISGKLVKKGKVTIPYTINGKSYKTNIKVIII